MIIQNTGSHYEVNKSNDNAKLYEKIGFVQALTKYTLFFRMELFHL